MAITNRVLRRFAKQLVAFAARLRSFHLRFFPNRQLHIIIGDERIEFLTDIFNRLTFYAPEISPSRIDILSSFGWRSIIGQPLVLDFSRPDSYRSILFRRCANSFQVDHRIEIAAWEWVRLSSWYCSVKYDENEAFQILSSISSELIAFGYQKAYVFGTGPSLSHAQSRSWDDGFRIVCNTIVRDPILFEHIDPHFIVAGDALYHFSETAFAREFRRDLKDRLDSSNCCFVYPSIFDSVVKRELGCFSDRLIGIPSGGPQSAAVNLISDFRLPSLGNVLGLLLLPLATTFSRRVELCGFDGRSPTDNQSPFWANSAKHSYPELMHTLKDSYPFFFDYYVPGNNSRDYIQSCHGDLLDELMLSAEANGFNFKMLHPSWTATLNKRYPGSLSPQDYSLDPAPSLLR